jgi:hypothetical protein
VVENHVSIQIIEFHRRLSTEQPARLFNSRRQPVDFIEGVVERE